METTIRLNQSSELDKKAIGKRVRKIRLQNGLSQAKFAETLDVSTNFVSELETGKKGMSIETLSRLSLIYHVTADYVLFGTASSSCHIDNLEHALSATQTKDIPVIINFLQSLYKIRSMKDFNGKFPL